MKRSGYNTRRKYIFLHENNTQVDSSSFSFTIRFIDHGTQSKQVVSTGNYTYIVDTGKKASPANIVTFFIPFRNSD